MASTEYTLIIYSPMEEVWFYEILFFQVVIVMVKDKKRCIVKDAMSIKTSFMHYKNYITWTRVKLPVVFEEFDMVYIFWLLFFFPLVLSVDKRSTLAKIWGDCSPPALPPGFYGPEHILQFDTKTEVFTQNKFFWIPGDGCPHFFVH